MKNKILLYLPSIVFNVVEVLIIVLIGTLLDLSIKETIMILTLFAIMRMSLGGSLHYKDWYKCMIWSTLVFLSLFVVAKTEILICIIMTIFCACILTTKGNISDIFMWRNKSFSKYADIEEYVKYHEFDDDLIDFENKLKTKDNLSYLVYKYRFKEHKSFNEISELLDLDNPRIVERLDNIAFSIRLYCKI